MKNEQEILTALLRVAVSGDLPEDELCQSLDDDMLEKVYLLAVKHSVTPLIADVLFKYNLLDTSKLKEYYQRSLLGAVLRYHQQNAELIKLCQLLEENKIPHIPLKGSVLRKFYSDPWLRTSCDIDILVHHEDLERAVVLLKDNAYTMKEKGSHDISFYSQNDVHLELHYNVIEKEYKIANVSSVLSQIWEYATPKSGYKYQYILSNEMFYFYHIAHMAKHFRHGGCGIRPFLDLWILNNRMKFDMEKRKDLLKKGKILTFAEVSEKLSNVWFSNDTHTELSGDVQDYILNGGVYGNLENRIAVRQTQTGSKFKSAWSKIFLSYDIIKYHYPVLQKHKWLLPFMEIRRWGKLIFFKEHRNRSIKHLAVNQNVTEELKTHVKELRDYLEI